MNAPEFALMASLPVLLISVAACCALQRRGQI
jgi:hypothetical protein